MSAPSKEAYEPTDEEWARLFLEVEYACKNAGVPHDTAGIREAVRAIIDNAQAEADAQLGTP